MSFISELKRRNVFRVAAAYVVTSWLLVQIADIVLENIGAPEWVIQTLFLILALGFIIALIISWAYEMTPEGVKRERDVVRDESITHVTARKLDYVTVAAAVGVAGMFAWQQFLAPARTSPPVAAQSTNTETQQTDTQTDNNDMSIAVLPFVNMSADKDNEYFSDGISEELLNVLVRVDGLQVASRTSAFSFKNKEVSIPDVANALRVNHIVEGSVRRADDQVRITAQLIDVRTDSHLWSDTYTRELKDVFAIQNEIATAIANALELTLLGETTDRKTDNIEAYDLYLLGRHHFHLRTPESLEKAIDLFEQTLALDPEFALAYSGLADTYSLVFQYGDFDPQLAMSKAHQNALKAVELAPELAEAHASLGLALAVQNRPPRETQLHYRRAIELNPDYSMAHMWLGSNLFAKPIEALAAFRKAEQVDPLHPVIAENIGYTLGRTGRFEEGAEHLEKAVALHPDTVVLHSSRSGLEFDRGDFAEAYRWARKAIAVDPDSSYALASIVFAETDLGNLDRAEAWLQRFKTIAPDHPTLIPATWSLYESRNDIEKLLAYTRQLIPSAPGPTLPYLRIGEASALIRLDDPQTALQNLNDIQEHDVGAQNYLGILILKSLAQQMLESNSESESTAQEGLELAGVLRSNGVDQPWLSDNETSLLALLNRRDEAIEKFQSAFDQGLRNVYGFSSLWIQDILIGDDVRYQKIRDAISTDVQEQQRIIAAELQSCKLKQSNCSLADINDVE